MDEPRLITGDQILQIVENILEIPVSVFTSRVRKRDYVDARKIAAVLMYVYTPLTLSTIAVKLGMGPERHDTIVHYKKVLPELMRTDRRLRTAYECADEECMRYSNRALFSKDNDPIENITRSRFVKEVMEAIDWEEKGTTRLNLEVLYYKMFKLREYE